MLLPDVERIALRDIELSEPPGDVEGLGTYKHLLALARLHGTPIGHVLVEVRDGVASASELARAIGREHSETLARVSLEHALSGSTLLRPRLADLVAVAPAKFAGSWPSVTVAVCTRDRPADLERCLEALLGLDYPGQLELLVVDNAPSSEASAQLVRARFPTVRYVLEARPGLDWARNRAIAESNAEIVAYTDDDVVVDAGWVAALARTFADNPAVMAVTGLVVPYELELPAQLEFERHGGFGRGFLRTYHGANVPGGEHAGTYHTGTSRFGTGANMAYRRSIFEAIGRFDPALDVGTLSNGGGDLEMFFRVIKGGFLLVYEPAAMVRHRHRRSQAELETQIGNNGVALYSYIVRSMLHFPEERLALARSGLWWLAYWSTRNLVANVARGRKVQAKLSASELMGSFFGMLAYPRARTIARALAGASLPQLDRLVRSREPPGARPHARAVRSADLAQLVAIDDVAQYPSLRVFVWWSGRLLGEVDILNLYGPVSVSRLRGELASQLCGPILEAISGNDADAAIDYLCDAYLSPELTEPVHSRPEPPGTILSDELSASVVVATLDRPFDLRDCLTSLTTLAGARHREILVVDTNPGSGLTAPVVAEFPEVQLLARPGASVLEARRWGIARSSGQLVALLDDTSVAPVTWLEALLAPFARPEVAAVTGNVLPFELETEAQQMFEHCDGMSRRFKRVELMAAWPVPSGAASAGRVGSSSNAAFRASVLRDPALGLLDDARSFGLQSAGAEVELLFFRLVEAGNAVVHEPSCVLWQRQRGSVDNLRQRVFDEAQGQVALDVSALAREGDAAVLGYIGRTVVPQAARRLAEAGLNELRGKPSHPPILALLESAGNLLGPLESLRRRKRAGG